MRKSLNVKKKKKKIQNGSTNVVCICLPVHDSCTHDNLITQIMLDMQTTLFSLVFLKQYLNRNLILYLTINFCEQNSWREYNLQLLS